MLRPVSSKHNSFGDTIIEVLLCISIVGLAVAGSYALASRSLRTGVLATERTQANKRAEAQIEALKFRERLSSFDIWQDNFSNPAPNNFCLDDSVTSQNDGSGNLTPGWLPKQNTGTDPDNLVVKGSTTGYDPACVDTSGKYFINITDRTNPSHGPGVTYLITVRWFSIASGVVSQSQIYFRLPDQQFSTTTTPPPTTCTPAGTDIVMLMDASSSMTESFTFQGRSTTKWDVLKRVSSGFVDDVNISAAGSHAGVISFDNSTVVESPITASRVLVQSAIARMNTRANTFVIPGLQASAQQFSANGRAGHPKLLILLTDGTFDDNFTNIKAEADNLKNNNPDLVLDTVGIDLPSQSARDNLATLSNGVSVNVTSGDDLQSILASISSDITCTNPAPPPPPPPPPACSYNYIALAIDHSNNMTFRFRGTTRIEAAKEIIRQFAQKANLGDSANKASLSEFAGESDPASTLQPMTSLESAILNADNSISAIAAPRQGRDFTDTAGGLTEAYNQLIAQPSTGTKIAIVIGDDWQFARTAAETTAVANTMASKGIRIYSIGMFDRNDAAAAAFYSTIPRNGGTYVWGGDDAALNRLYSNFAAGAVGTCL
jgi:type II secretory pathway pseudopilin PulG